LVLLVQPGGERVQQRPGFFLSHPGSLRGRKFLGAVLDIVELPDPGEGLVSSRRIGAAGIVKLSPHMRPTSHLGDRTGRTNAVIAGEGIRLQVTGKVLQELHRSIALAVGRVGEDRVGMPAIAQVGPHPTRLGPVLVGIEHRDWCVVGVDYLRVQHPLDQQLI
jgi:hypothetical protein